MYHETERERDEDTSEEGLGLGPGLNPSSDREGEHFSLLMNQYPIQFLCTFQMKPLT